MLTTADGVWARELRAEALWRIVPAGAVGVGRGAVGDLEARSPGRVGELRVGALARRERAIEWWMAPRSRRCGASEGLLGAERGVVRTEITVRELCSGGLRVGIRGYAAERQVR